MKTIEIPTDLYMELLEKALAMNYRAPADVIRFLLNQSKMQMAAGDSPPFSISATQNLVTKGGPLPNGIKLRAVYKGQTFSAIVNGGAIVAEGKQFRSPSAAAIYVAKLQGTPNPSINGWKFWEYFDSSANQWKILDNLRKALEGRRSAPSPTKNDKEIFICKGKDADAKGAWRSGKFIVLKNSKANLEETPSQLATNKKIRSQVLNEGVLRRENGYLIFTRDYPFNSLSTAAGVVLGRSANGKTEWRAWLNENSY